MNLLDELQRKRPHRSSPKGRMVYNGSEEDYSSQKYNPHHPLNAEWERRRVKVRELHGTGLGTQSIVNMTGFSRTFVNDTLRALRNADAKKPWEGSE